MNPRPPTLLDSHIHLDDPRFDPDREALLKQAHAAGLRGWVVPAISARHWPRLRAVCRDIDHAWPAYGLHPCFLDEHREQIDLPELAAWIACERPVAVGECGLDGFISNPRMSRQHALFEAQLALAREFRLPIIIHARRAVEEVIGLIRASGHHQGVVHSFNGSWQQAERLIDLGYHLGFGGAVTYPRARKLQRLLQAVPDDALLLETDAPDQPDAAGNPERNEPARLAAILEHCAELRGCTPYKLALTTRRNTRRLFNLVQ